MRACTDHVSVHTFPVGHKHTSLGVALRVACVLKNA